MNQKLVIGISGVSGFIGDAILNRLAKTDNFKLIGFYRTENKINQFLPYVQYRCIDFIDLKESIECDIFIHCAGLASDLESYDNLYSNNVIATSNLIDALKNCTKFIFISSSSVYNFEDKSKCSESDSSLDSILSNYGKTKLLAEQIVLNSSISTRIVLRPRAVYGSGDTTLMPKLLKLVRKNTLFYPGKSSINSSLTHIENLISAIETCLSCDIVQSSVYNIADNQLYNLCDVVTKLTKKIKEVDRIVFLPISLMYLIAKLGDKFGLKFKLNLQSLGYFNTHSILEISKAINEINYRPTVGFNDYFNELNTNSFPKSS